MQCLSPALVASFTDAWIETDKAAEAGDAIRSRPSRTRGLKQLTMEDGETYGMSRPSRTRGLKLQLC